MQGRLPPRHSPLLWHPTGPMVKVIAHGTIRGGEPARPDDRHPEPLCFVLPVLIINHIYDTHDGHKFSMEDIKISYL